MRNSFLALACLTTILTGCYSAMIPSTPPAAPLNGEEAWERLLNGNQRFVANRSAHPDQTAARRTEVAKGQKPFAIVLTCADSRLSPEILFDQGLGDLFVVRNAGNLVDDHALGSMEYAVEHLHAPLIVVLGHSQCGAVSAAVAGGEAPGHIKSLVDAIEPSVESTKSEAGDKLDNAVRANAKRMAELTSEAKPILDEAVKSGKLKIVAARYDLATGKVEAIQ